MKTGIRMLCALVLAATAPAACALGTEFTFQGTLDEAGAPANGTYDFAFRLVDAGGNELAPSMALEDVAVERGRFTVRLDFGAFAAAASTAFVAVAVRPGASADAHAPLTPPVAVTAVPHATSAEFAATAANVFDGSITAPKIASNSVGSAQIANASIGVADIDTQQVQRRLAQHVLPIPTASVTRNSNCAANSGGIADTADGASATLPAGTYLVTMPVITYLVPVDVLENNVRVAGTASVELELRSASSVYASSRQVQGAGTAATSIVDMDTRIVFLSQPTAVFVRARAFVGYCGQAQQTAGRTLTVVRID